MTTARELIATWPALADHPEAVGAVLADMLREDFVRKLFRLGNPGSGWASEAVVGVAMPLDLEQEREGERASFGYVELFLFDTEFRLGLRDFADLVCEAARRYVGDDEARRAEVAPLLAQFLEKVSQVEANHEAWSRLQDMA